MKIVGENIMVKGLTVIAEPKTFMTLTKKGPSLVEQFKAVEEMPLTQKNMIIRGLSGDIDLSKPEVIEAYKKAMELVTQGKWQEGINSLKQFLPNRAATKDTSLGVAVMAEGWEKPVIFPKKEGFKWIGWADEPANVSTEELWQAAYGEVPAARLGAVGNSNIKPEQVQGGCAMSRKELSQKYEDAIQDFYRPIISFLEDAGAKSEDIGFAFAHSDCGVDKAARSIVEEHGLKGFGTTPTEYTQYLRGTEIPPSEEFPNGAILADFPFPTVLTRNLSQIVDYASIYGKMVGKEQPLGIFGGGTHAFVHDTGTALVGKDGSRYVPVDLMKDRFGIVIPAKNDTGEVINASRNILDRINSNPHEQYKYAFKNFLPSTQSKQDLQHDGQQSIATIAYTELAKAGKIGK